MLHLILRKHKSSICRLKTIIFLTAGQSMNPSMDLTFLKKETILRGMNQHQSHTYLLFLIMLPNHSNLKAKSLCRLTFLKEWNLLSKHTWGYLITLTIILLTKETLNYKMYKMNLPREGIKKRIPQSIFNNHHPKSRLTRVKKTLTLKENLLKKTFTNPLYLLLNL